MTAAIGEFDDPPRGKRGRPRKVQQVTKQEFIVDDDAPEEKDEAFSGLFDETTLRQVVRVRVIRKEPNEGTVGYLEDPTLGEAEIFERWGGSTYLVQALDIKGMVKRAATVKIAGDPIFVSTTAEMQWRRSRGLPPVVTAGAANQAPAAQPAMTMQEMMLFLQSQDERRLNAEREHQAALKRLELEAREKEKRDDEERERRRARDEEERDNRRRRDQQEAEQRQQQFMQQTIQMLQQSSAQALNFVRATAAPAGNTNLMEAVKTVVAIKEAFAGDEGSGEETPMNLLIKHGGEWINGLSSGIAGAVREIKAGGVNGAAGATPVSQQQRVGPTASPASPLALLPANHPINEKVETLVAKLAAKGLDPISAMSTIVDNVLRDVEKIPQQGAPTPTAAADAPKPFTHDPNTVARVTTEPVVSTSAPATVTTSSPVAGPRVYRHSFGR